MSDQHHPRFMSCAGEPLVQTPNLDALAARGTRFSNAYCNFPLCCPSRMSFLSSRLPSQISCLTNSAQLGSDVPTFAHAFNEADYETVLCGRMHINGPDQRHGFVKRIIGDVTPVYERQYATIAQVLGDVLKGTTGPDANAIRVSGPGESGYQAYDRAVTDAAVNYLNERDADGSSPFMMVVGYVLPHAPFVAPPEDYALYDKQITIDDLPQHDPDLLHPEMHRLQRRARLEDTDPVALEDQRRARVAYYGMCTYLDRLIGEVVASLESTGQLENTIIVYTSDHGEQLGEHGMWWKHTFYEGSVGVPLIFAGPGVPQGHVADGNVSLLDIGPTLLGMAGGPEIPRADGRSFRCLFDDNDAAWHDTVIAENLWPPDAPCLHRMIKRGPWKLCHYHGYEPQLFNLDDDPQELNDRAADPACQAVCDELMRDLLHNWDHDAIMREHQADLQIQTWAGNWRQKSDLPEPDALWFDEAPENWVGDGR